MPDLQPAVSLPTPVWRPAPPVRPPKPGSPTGHSWDLFSQGPFTAPAMPGPEVVKQRSNDAVIVATMERISPFLVLKPEYFHLLPMLVALSMLDYAPAERLIRRRRHMSTSWWVRGVPIYTDADIAAIKIGFIQMIAANLAGNPRVAPSRRIDHFFHDCLDSGVFAKVCEIVGKPLRHDERLHTYTPHGENIVPNIFERVDFDRAWDGTDSCNGLTG